MLKYDFEPWYTATAENKEYMRLENQYADLLVQKEIEQDKKTESLQNDRSFHLSQSIK